ncbi:MAG TPA: chromosomal replication initiator protein DnaA [Thermomicrobiaceae bacterium]|nr:chromosomal replication initiator protein DnaA [Thermomicrobiaceae bacterium]
MQAKQIWQAALGDLEQSLSRANFETWLRNTEIVDFADDTATIGAPNSFAVDQLGNKFALPIQQALSTIVGRRIAVHFTVLNGGGRSSTRAPRRAAPEPVAQPGIGRSTAPALVPPAPQQLELTSTPEHGLNPRYTFEKFVVGSHNRLAHAAALAVADYPADRFNPLYIYGGVGLGKTHLLHAIGHRALARNPELRVRYVSSETFTNDMVNAIRQQQNEDFRYRYRSIDILMVDDIQFIAGKEGTQEEFFHTFNALHQAGKQVVISSDRPPKAIAALADRLRSRFEGGLLADIQVPDLETREAILAEKGTERGVAIPDDVREYVARKVESNIRELEGALNKILALGQLYSRPISLQLAIEALTDSALERRKRELTPDQVVDTVVSYYQITRRDIVGPGRRRDLVVPRQVAMFLLRSETETSLVEIGHCLSRDHSTVLHGIEKVERQLEQDQRLRGELLAIREILYSATG